MKIRSLFILCTSTMMLFISCGKNELTTSKKTNVSASSVEVAACTGYSTDESKSMVVVTNPLNTSVSLKVGGAKRYLWNLCKGTASAPQECIEVADFRIDYNTWSYKFYSQYGPELSYKMLQSDREYLTIQMSSKIKYQAEYRVMQLLIKDSNNQTIACQSAINLTGFGNFF